jgi:hypothetical protein
VVAAPTESRMPTGTERNSFTQECGWKGRNRAAWLDRKDEKTKERALFTLDMEQPSHRRTWHTHGQFTRRYRRQ